MLRKFWKLFVLDLLIGVHCTHGVNRTGYLVCRYMIDKLDFQPKNAIEGQLQLLYPVTAYSDRTYVDWERDRDWYNAKVQVQVPLPISCSVKVWHNMQWPIPARTWFRSSLSSVWIDYQTLHLHESRLQQIRLQRDQATTTFFLRKEHSWLTSILKKFNTTYNEQIFMNYTRCKVKPSVLYQIGTVEYKSSQSVSLVPVWFSYFNCILAFNTARGYDIERENYLGALKNGAR